VGLKELPNSSREIHISLKKIHKWKRDLCISLPEIRISSRKIHISSADSCISPKETQSAAAKLGDVSSARGEQKRQFEGSGAAFSRVQLPQRAVAD